MYLADNLKRNYDQNKTVIVPTWKKTMIVVEKKNILLALSASVRGATSLSVQSSYTDVLVLALREDMLS